MNVVNEQSDGSMEITLRGEALRLLPEGALSWPKLRTVFVADFHLGKAETFGLHGLSLPGRAQYDDLEKLELILAREKARRLVFLGDLVHARAGLTTQNIAFFADTLRRFGGEVILTAGNHDQGLLRHWPGEWTAVSVKEEWREGPFVFRHDPSSPSEKAFAWAGHLHPCVRLGGGADRLRLKAFVVERNRGVLPAFSSLAGGCDLSPTTSRRLYPMVEGKVYAL